MRGERIVAWVGIVVLGSTAWAAPARADEEPAIGREARFDARRARLDPGERLRSTATEEDEAEFPGRALFLVYECPRCTPGLGFLPILTAAEEEPEGEPICATVNVHFPVGAPSRALSSAAEIEDAYEQGEVTLVSTDETYRCVVISEVPDGEPEVEQVEEKAGTGDLDRYLDEEAE